MWVCITSTREIFAQSWSKGEPQTSFSLKLNPRVSVITVTCISSGLGHTFLERGMRVSKFQLSRELFKTILREERRKAQGKCHR